MDVIYFKNINTCLRKDISKTVWIKLGLIMEGTNTFYSNFSFWTTNNSFSKTLTLLFNKILYCSLWIGNCFLFGVCLFVCFIFFTLSPVALLWVFHWWMKERRWVSMTKPTYILDASIIYWKREKQRKKFRLLRYR